MKEIKAVIQPHRLPKIRSALRNIKGTACQKFVQPCAISRLFRE